MAKNLILIGFMGTGKTSIGKKLAKELNYSFLDTDAEIERITGLTIPQLFRKHGEVRFRSEEAAAIFRVVQKGNQVIATGGGAVLKDTNVKLLQQSGVLFCLTARPEIIEERVQRRNNRPLLKHNENITLRQRIEELLAERQQVYSCADYIIDTSDVQIEEVARHIAQVFRQHLKENRR